jgi:MoxR-like ATPase
LEETRRNSQTPPDLPADPQLTPELAAVGALRERTLSECRRVLVGLDEALEQCLVALLIGGHVLLEGPPGVAKTLLVRTLATALGGSFGRVQFTPDLMPADITGTSIFRPNEGAFRFSPGPIFAQYLLCDEINRAPAKTQAALLEAMQEAQVTADGTAHALPQPFAVFATQNPIEQEGTYPLPEAQLDRFVFKVLIGYPDEAAEVALLASVHGLRLSSQPAERGVRAVTTPEELLELRAAVLGVHVREDLPAYLVRLLRATREDRSFVLGASPRAGVTLLAAAKARAALSGRAFVIPDDIKAVFIPGLRHRVVLDPAEELEGGSSDAALRRVLDLVPVPR